MPRIASVHLPLVVIGAVLSLLLGRCASDARPVRSAPALCPTNTLLQATSPACRDAR